MLTRIAFVAALIAVALVVVSQQKVLQNAGPVGYCSRVATPVGKTGFWHECRSGKVTGTPAYRSRRASASATSSTGTSGAVRRSSNTARQ